jgi:uncharacterized protein (DUF4415 family)
MVRYTLDEVKAKLARGEDRTDWDRLKLMTEEELEAAVKRDADDVDYPSGWPEGVTQGLPEAVAKVPISVDADVVRWFRSLGPRQRMRINAVLRSYMKAHSGADDR